MAASQPRGAPIGTTLQEDAHEPHPWRALTAKQQALFDLGYAVFNTEWVPANTPAGRIDGLGPLFNSRSCDACHNSRRRGRGPRADGEAPSDLVMQLGRIDPAATDRAVTRGSADYGFVLNTSAISGLEPEGRVWIQYELHRSRLADGTIVELREPHYRLDRLSGPPLPSNTVLMPRVPPPVQGLGLLERVPQSELEEVVRSEQDTTPDIRGAISWLTDGPRSLIGRFGWQASEPALAHQIGIAFAREMGLTNPQSAASDCGRWNVACRSAASGGAPEVEADLFEAVVAFERWHAVPVAREPDQTSVGAQLFQSTGCADCHRMRLHVQLGSQESAIIHPYTDLLIHSLGEPIADRDIHGQATSERWRTAPLWGMHAAYVAGQPLHLLHDGRARSIEEAILWHDAEGRRARERYAHLSEEERRALVDWVENL